MKGTSARRALAKKVRKLEDGGVSLAQTAQNRIEDLIVTLELKPRSWVTERSLVERLRLGRTPIREAMFRLATEKLLVAEPHRGMMVCEIDIATQLKVLEARRPLELVMVRAAARRRTDADAERIASIVDQFVRRLGQKPYADLLRLDRELVDELLRTAQNPFLGVIRPLYTLSRRFWFAYEGRLPQFKPADITKFHIDVGRAVIAGDEGKAVANAEAFLDYIERFTRAVASELI